MVFSSDKQELFSMSASMLTIIAQNASEILPIDYMLGIALKLGVSAS